VSFFIVLTSVSGFYEKSRPYHAKVDSLLDGVELVITLPISAFAVVVPLRAVEAVRSDRLGDTGVFENGPIIGYQIEATFYEHLAL
jgi:hypothetical protein